MVAPIEGGDNRLSWNANRENLIPMSPLQHGGVKQR